jgi:hypothetical protein
MARGCESKSVEAQIDEAESQRSAALKKIASREELEVLRKRETILLSRTRVVRELNNAQNPRYKEVLNKALADLEAQLSTFAAS